MVMEGEYDYFRNICIQLQELGGHGIQEVSEEDNLYALVTNVMIMWTQKELLFEFLSLALT